MNRDFKRYLYIFAGVMIFIMVAKLFIKLLPWLIAVGGIVYVVSKIKSASSKKELKNNYENKYRADEDNRQTYYESDPEDYTNGEVIDVDYEDVDKK